VRKIIARSIVYINKLAIYKSVKRIEAYIEFLILNITKNKLRKRELKELQSIDLHIMLFANKR